MSIKWSNVVSKTDWIKIIILVIFSVGCWMWVYVEYKKPFLDQEWQIENVKEEI